MTEPRSTELAARICQQVLDLNRLFDEAAKEGLVVDVEVERGFISRQTESPRNVVALRVSVAQPSASISAQPSVGEDSAQ